MLESESMDSLNNLYPAQLPDLLILGVGPSSHTNVSKLIVQTKSSYPLAKIIMYDEAPSHDRKPLPGNSVSLDYLRAGVNGYLTKQNDLTDLLDCVRDVLKGKRYICSQALDVLLDKPLEKNTDHRASHLLTSREYEVARYLSDGMKTSVIARKLNRKASTISTTKTNIFKKLEVDNILKLRQIMVSDQTTLHL